MGGRCDRRRPGRPHQDGTGEDRGQRAAGAAPGQPGDPFPPVELTGLAVIPYVNPAGRLAYSLKATGITPVRGARGSSRAAGPAGRARPDAGRDGRELAPSGRPRSLPLTRREQQEEVIIVCATVHGEQYAQVDNADPFAPAVWRSPVHRTPEWIIWLVQLVRLLARVVWFVIRHPLLDVAAGVLVLAWYQAGWPGVIAAVTSAARRCWSLLRIVWPGWFARLVTVPARCRWRWWWTTGAAGARCMTIAGLGPKYRGQVTLPALGKVQAGPCADLVAVRLVSGQSPKLFADRAEELAHGFGAHSCRVRTARPGQGGAGVRPPRCPGGGDPRPADPPGAGPAGAAGGPVRGRRRVHDPAARHAPAHRGLDGGGEGLLPVGAGPGPAARDGRRAGAGACV